MRKKYDSASSLTICKLKNYQETLEDAIKLCEKHRYSYFFGGYSTKDRTWHEDKNSMTATFIVYTMGELEIDISTTYSCSHTYFTSRFYLNGERRDLRIARKALRVIKDQITTKIELGIE